ncbi:MAG TPA: hypothetical protein VLL50_12430, partial [Usitatibacter sp.]|nr:hypothetical protein [Usitatibacter sp.]
TQLLELTQVPAVALTVDRHGVVYWRTRGSINKLSDAKTPMLLAGSSTETGTADGTGASARFGANGGIAADASGNIYVADTDNSTVRKVTPGGVVTTIAGVPGSDTFAPGSLPGGLAHPTDVVPVGSNLYVTMPTAIAVVRNRP